MTGATKKIMVVAEHLDNRVEPATYETIAFAEKIARSIGAEMTIAILGRGVENLAKELAAHSGCDVIAADSPSASVYHQEAYRAMIKELAESSKPDFIFIPHTYTGWDYAPALAVDLKASCVAAVSGFKHENEIVLVRSICNGKILEEVKPLRESSAVVTVTTGIETTLLKVAPQPGSVKTIQMEAPETKTKIVGQIEPPPASARLREADVIVAVGRGIAESKHLNIIYDLVALFNNAAVGASRPLCDLGWLPIESQVGMTGQTVAPKLYIAVGISGAVQHTMGMRNSELIIAVNHDRNAQIFQIAHYCVVADTHRFIPTLTEKIRELKNSSLT